MSNTEKILKKFQNALKLSGFNIRREFCSQLVNKFIEANVDISSNSIFDETIRNICSSLENQCVSGHSIDQEHIERALEVCLRSGYDVNETIFNVINAFDFPKLYYNQDRKIYLPDTRKSTLLADADVKAKVMLDRYSAILQRVKRQLAGSLLKEEKSRFQLQTVDYLLTLSEITLENTVILGAIAQVSEGKYFLEDPTGMVELDLKFAKFKPGFYVESSFVLVNGYYEDKVLHVSTILLPQGEEYSVSRPSFGNLNYFGGDSSVPLKDSKRLKKHMIENSNNTFVFLSDVWLDHPQVFDKLDKLFEKMEEFCPPVAFVFMGNFMSESHGSELMTVSKKLFKRLAELIARYQVLVGSSQFVFVPGLADPCTPHILPRLQLPNYVTEDMKKILPNAIFATNPCRIQYCTKEIVVLRADVLAKLLQGSLHKPDKEDIPKCITRTIVSQGHLSPLSLNALTVHWDFDYCLSLYPLPDLVVIGDRSEAYKDDFKGCIVMNPGQFCTGNFLFKMYSPSSDISEAVMDCEIDIEEDTNV